MTLTATKIYGNETTLYPKDIEDNDYNKNLKYCIKTYVKAFVSNCW